jgi:thiamine transport system substrate-binding protein
MNSSSMITACALPVDYGDVCINYDRAYFEENNWPCRSPGDLVKPEYAACWW